MLNAHTLHQSDIYIITVASLLLYTYGLAEKKEKKNKKKKTTTTTTMTTTTTTTTTMMMMTNALPDLSLASNWYQIGHEAVFATMGPEQVHH